MRNAPFDEIAWIRVGHSIRIRKVVCKTPGQRLVLDSLEEEEPRHPYYLGVTCISPAQTNEIAWMSACARLPRRRVSSRKYGFDAAAFEPSGPEAQCRACRSSERRRRADRCLVQAASCSIGNEENPGGRSNNARPPRPPQTFPRDFPSEEQLFQRIFLRRRQAFYPR